jgi:hypothetical protein
MEDLLQVELEKARDFFTKQAKNDACFYKLYDVKYIDTKFNRDDLRASNYETTSQAESLERLASDMRHLGDRAAQFWVVRHYANKADSQPISFYLKNVFYNPENHKHTANVSINGFGSGSINGDMIGLLKEHFKQTAELKQEMAELRHQYEMERMEDRISELENSKKGKLDAVNDFLETPIGSQLGGALLALLQVKLLGQVPAVPAPVLPVEQETEQSSDSANFEQDEQIHKVSKSLERFQKVFGGDSIAALEKVSIFCEKNPIVAQNLLKKETDGL